jgi:hypothetical protein
MVECHSKWGLPKDVLPAKNRLDQKHVVVWCVKHQTVYKAAIREIDPPLTSLKEAERDDPHERTDDWKPDPVVNPFKLTDTSVFSPYEPD